MGHLSDKSFGRQKLIRNYREVPQKPLKNVFFFEKVLQLQGITMTCRKAGLGSLHNVALLNCKVNDHVQ